MYDRRVACKDRTLFPVRAADSLWPSVSMPHQRRVAMSKSMYNCRACFKECVQPADTAKVQSSSTGRICVLPGFAFSQSVGSHPQLQKGVTKTKAPGLRTHEAGEVVPACMDGLGETALVRRVRLCRLSREHRVPHQFFFPNWCPEKCTGAAAVLHMVLS